MNVKKYLIGSIVVFVFIFLYEYVLHGILLHGMYAEIPNLMRTEENVAQFFFWVFLGELILAFGFCYIFTKGYEGRGVVEGMRYGLLVGITFGVSANIIQYAVQPFPGKLTTALSIGYPVEMMLAGLIIAAIYRPANAG